MGSEMCIRDSLSAGGAETFRSRGQSGASLQGPGFPAPSRAPRESARTVPTAPPVAASTTAAAAPDRRAVPRSADGTTTARQGAVTRRLDVPGYTRAPEAADRRPSGSVDSPGGQTGVRPGSDRGQTGVRPGSDPSVPRGSGSYAPRADDRAPAGSRVYGPYAPRAATDAAADSGVIRHYGIPPRYVPPNDRGALAAPREPGSSATPARPANADPARSGAAPGQAVPRGYGAPAATPPPQYRSGPGPDRGAPAGPRGGGPGAAPSGDGGHQRGGGQATGTAVRRGRG